MARYIKANPKVVNYLHLENDRNKLKDGNYILWLQDMMAFGPLPHLADTLQRIGAIALLPHEAREEQYGTTTRPLPVATDPKFVIEVADETPTEETPANSEAETQSEETEESNEESNEETEESNEETESIDSGDVGDVEDVLNPNNEEE